MLEGSATFLQQAHRNNWQVYLNSLQPESAQGWDVCVLTASDERQAGIYRRQLALRREAGLLPSHTRFEVLADPAGERIGSGGATLRVLAMLMQQGNGALPRKVLIIHSGGDSRRLPHCSASGKLFARVPRELPDGRASTVFDEFLVSLSGIASGLRSGVLIASGDVLLVFDHLQLSFPRAGITGVAAAVPAEMGLHHGVYVPDGDAHQVRAYLHKPGLKELTAWGAIRDGNVLVDTGLVWLDSAAATRWVSLLGQESVAALCREQPRHPAEPLPPGAPRANHNGHHGGEALGPAGQLNLYGDLLLPLAQSTTYESYLADTSDGPCTPLMHAARIAIWRELRGTALSFEELQPATFVHFGSSEEYHETATDPALRAICNWAPHVASWCDASTGLDSLTLMNALVQAEFHPGQDPIVLVDSQVAGSFVWPTKAILSGVRTAQPLALMADIALSQVPVACLSSAEKQTGGWVTRIYGLQDNPKRAFGDPGATYLNRPWADWFAQVGISAEDLWPGVPEGQRTLWNARLFPCLADREASLRLSLPLQNPALVSAAWREAWQKAERLSLAQSFQSADLDRLAADVTDLEDEIAGQRFLAAVRSGQPATSAKRWLGRQNAVVRRRCERVSDWLALADPLLRIRGNKALAVALDDKSYEDRAFTVLADMIGRSLIAEQRAATSQSKIGNPKSKIESPVRVEAAARIDFGGGWTDTPPYSIEFGGCVLNAAVTLRGAYPIVAEAAWIDAPQIVLESKEIGSRLELHTAGEVLDYANPADPFALLKAALVVCGVVPPDCRPDLPLKDLLRPFGAGLWLSTQANTPRGSGLGTSSILAGAVLQALHKLLGDGTTSPQPSPIRGGGIAVHPGDLALGGAPESAIVNLKSEIRNPKSSILFDEVLWLEQLMTTGGGWQDQVGGLAGGIKLLTTAPGLPQHIQIEPVTLPYHAQKEFAERLLLVYTGQQRLAKNLLRNIMGRWMSRDTDMAWMLGEIARLALAMRDALSTGDLDSFAWLLAEHWSINKRMDPGCSNPFIDHLFDTMQPFIGGGKLAGAGGGGFALVLAHDAQAAHDLQHDLTLRYRGTPVSVWPCAVAESASTN
jgi:fucokinase